MGPIRLLKMSGHCCWRRSHELQVVPMQWAILAKFGAGLAFRGSSTPCYGSDGPDGASRG